MLKIYTIGVYGFTAESFFKKLVEHKIDALIDIRRRRGVRGTEFSFCNKIKLIQKLKELNIHYSHAEELSPTPEIRSLQKIADKESNINKKNRYMLCDKFIEKFKSDMLSATSPDHFMNKYCLNHSKIVLLCVERNPLSCHRSLVADWLREKQELEIIHLVP